MSTFANVNVGSSANDHTGDPLRNSFIKINQNFANIAGGTAGGVTSVAGRVGNVVLSVNDVQGAANVYFVTTTVAAGNAYVDAAVANLGNVDVVTLTSRINVIDANLGVATNNITALTANAAAQATSINTLTANAAAQATSINTLTANAAAQATSITNLNNTISGFNTSIGDLTSNSASLAGQITVLTANAAAQSDELIAVRANVVAANASIATLTANAAAQGASINTLTANAAAQHNSIVGLTANAVTQSLELDTLTANASTQATAINLINANVGTYQTWANANVSAHAVSIDSLQTDVDSHSASISILTANAAAQHNSIIGLTANAAAQSLSIDTLTANAAAQAAGINILNANVGAYQIWANANVSAHAADISSLQTNAAVQGASINTLTANAAAQHNSIVGLTANAATQSLSIATLTANAAVQSLAIDTLDTEFGAYQIWANANIATMSGSISDLDAASIEQATNINTLTANAAAQATSITTLAANAAVQAIEINQLRANITAANAVISSIVVGSTQVLDANVGAYQIWSNANASVQSTDITNLWANAAAQYAQLQAANTVSGSGIQTLSSNIGAYQTYANANAATQASAISNLTSSKANLNGATFTGNIVADSGAETVNSHTGGIVVRGAAGIAVGGNVNIESMLFVGVDAQSPFLNKPITVERSTSTSGPGVQYTQHAIINATSTGSSDFIAYPNNYPGFGNDHGWVDLGVAGSAFDDPLYTITHPNDCYLFGSAPTGVGAGGNLVIATDDTGDYNDVVIAVNGFHDANEIARFHANGDTRLTVLGNIIAGNIAVETVRVTDGVYWANGVSYAQTLSNTGNITFENYTISTVDAIGSAGITITPANGGEVHIDSFTGFNNVNPGYWVHVGDGSIGATNNTGNISVDVNDGIDSVRASTIIDYAWWNSASQGNDNRGTGAHKHFGIYKNDDSHDTAYVEWDLASGNATMTNVSATRITTTTGAFGQVWLTSAIQFANLTTAEVDGISGPTPGMTVYNYTTGNIQVYNGTKWANITLS